MYFFPLRMAWILIFFVVPTQMPSLSLPFPSLSFHIPLFFVVFPLIPFPSPSVFSLALPFWPFAPARISSFPTLLFSFLQSQTLCILLCLAAHCILPCRTCTSTPADLSHLQVAQSDRKSYHVPIHTLLQFHFDYELFECLFHQIYVGFKFR